MMGAYLKESGKQTGSMEREKKSTQKET